MTQLPVRTASQVRTWNQINPSASSGLRNSVIYDCYSETTHWPAFQQCRFGGNPQTEGIRASGICIFAGSLGGSDAHLPHSKNSWYRLSKCEANISLNGTHPSLNPFACRLEAEMVLLSFTFCLGKVKHLPFPEGWRKVGEDYCVASQREALRFPPPPTIRLPGLMHPQPLLPPKTSCYNQATALVTQRKLGYPTCLHRQVGLQLGALLSPGFHQGSIQVILRSEGV